MEKNQLHILLSKGDFLPSALNIINFLSTRIAVSMKNDSGLNTKART